MSGKYGDLIKKAREPDNQITSEQDNQKTKKPDDQKEGKQEKQIAKKPENQIEREPDIVPQPPAAEPEVNLCVKVPKSLRQHWAAEAKRQGITMTSVIMEALRARFGEPDNQ